MYVLMLGDRSPSGMCMVRAQDHMAARIVATKSIIPFPLSPTSYSSWVGYRFKLMHMQCVLAGSELSTSLPRTVSRGPRSVLLDTPPPRSRVHRQVKTMIRNKDNGWFRPVAAAGNRLPCARALFFESNTKEQQPQ